MCKPDSHVCFDMVSDLEGEEYREFIGKLLFDFILSVDPEVDERWARRELFRSRRNEESAIGMFGIKGEYVEHVKMYLFDERQFQGRRIIFRDHYSEADVRKVHRVANAFEAFLKSKGIGYTRHNQMR